MASDRTIDTQLVVPFGVGQSDGIYNGQVYVKYDTGFVPSNAYTMLAIYPIHPKLVLQLSHGGSLKKAQGFTQVIPVINDFIHLSGGREFTGRLPMDTPPEVDKDKGFYMTPEGEVVNARHVKFSYNPDKKILESNMELVGYVPVSYTHVYGRYLYTPKAASQGILQLDVVYAFVDRASSYLVVEPANRHFNLAIEVMSLYSEILVTENGSIPDYPSTGAFEKPLGWDNATKSGSYPNGFSLPTDTQVYEQRRVHVVWYYVGTSTYLRKDVLGVPFEAPYGGVDFSHDNTTGAVWSPELKLEVRSLDSIIQGLALPINRSETMKLINSEYEAARNQYGVA